MKWMIPEIDLDGEQRELLNVYMKQQTGNIWIKGHAGSGKSVLLVQGVRNFHVANNNLRLVIVVYTHAMIDMLRTGLKNIIGPNDIPIMTYFEFEKNGQQYDIIFVDEVQDLPKRILEKMKNRAGRIIAAGDQMQSIYEDGVSPEQINNVLAGTEYSLNNIHRLTPSLVSLVAKFIGNVGNILHAKINEKKVDVQIKLGRASSMKNEIEYVMKKSKEYSAKNYTAAILLPTASVMLEFCDMICDLEDVNRWKKEKFKGKPIYDSLNAHFGQNNIKFEYIGNKYGSLENAVKNGKVILMTYHSSKGLDFENVFMPLLTNNLCIFAKPAEKAETVFMVALTRSRNNLFLTYHGDKYHGYLERFCNEDFMVSFDIDNELENDNKPQNITDW